MLGWKLFRVSVVCGSACVALAIASSAFAGLVIYEPFDYTPAGAAITGQINNDSVNSPVTWAKAGTTNGNASLVHQVASGSLTAPSGFAASVGNSAALMQADNTEYNRLALDQQYGPNSTLYYSVLINVPSLTGLTTPNTNLAANNGVFIGFNNTPGISGTRPSVWGGRVDHPA